MGVFEHPSTRRTDSKRNEFCGSEALKLCGLLILTFCFKFPHVNNMRFSYLYELTLWEHWCVLWIIFEFPGVSTWFRWCHLLPVTERVPCHFMCDFKTHGLLGKVRFIIADEFYKHICTRLLCFNIILTVTHQVQHKPQSCSLFSDHNNKCVTTDRN